MKDEKGKERRISKLRIPRTFQEIYREMLYGDTYSGYKGVVEPLDGILNPDGTPRISIKTMRKYCPNWVRKMLESDKEFFTAIIVISVGIFINPSN